jgi:hypothetical protein
VTTELWLVSEADQTLRTWQRQDLNLWQAPQGEVQDTVGRLKGRYWHGYSGSNRARS